MRVSIHKTLVVFIHGTWPYGIFSYKRNKYCGLSDESAGLWFGRDNLCQRFLSSLDSIATPVHFMRFYWSGDNSVNERQIGAASLAEELDEIGHNYSSIFLIGHSHGGTIAINSIKLMEPWCRSKIYLITVGTPFIKSGIDERRVKDLFSAYAFLITVSLIMLILMKLPPPDHIIGSIGILSRFLDNYYSIAWKIFNLSIYLIVSVVFYYTIYSLLRLFLDYKFLFRRSNIESIVKKLNNASVPLDESRLLVLRTDGDEALSSISASGLIPTVDFIICISCNIFAQFTILVLVYISASGHNFNYIVYFSNLLFIFNIVASIYIILSQFGNSIAGKEFIGGCRSIVVYCHGNPDTSSSLVVRTILYRRCVNITRTFTAVDCRHRIDGSIHIGNDIFRFVEKWTFLNEDDCQKFVETNLIFGIIKHIDDRSIRHSIYNDVDFLNVCRQFIDKNRYRSSTKGFIDSDMSKSYLISSRATLIKTMENKMVELSQIQPLLIDFTKHDEWSRKNGATIEFDA